MSGDEDDSLPSGLRGVRLLETAAWNKGTAFTLDERERYGLHGLLPAAVTTQAMQMQRSMENLQRKATDIERYIFLMALLDRNERLFYRLLIEHIDALMPIVYTPTVGQACQEFAHIYRQARGMYITARDRGRIKRILRNWPEPDVRLIVVTDGQRILGLGDLGASGMGIPIGKLALYSACAGIEPRFGMPVLLDVGTDNQSLIDDPLYLGLRQPRLRGEAYFSLVDEFIDAVQQQFPGVLIQFEDFLTPNAHALLQSYRDRVCCFNDDIQGTAAMALAGVLAACRISGKAFAELRFLFLGAGSAATGIAALVCSALQREGLSASEARQRIYLVDRGGLITRERRDLDAHQKPFARDNANTGFIGVIEQARPHVLIGATGAAGSFTREAIEKMAAVNARPIIFALSNPTSQAECTAEQAYCWSRGRAIFASGSPFAPVEYNGRRYVPGQGNNAYVFPGIGLGVLFSRARRVSEEMFLDAAHVLANAVDEARLASGSVYPPLSAIRAISLDIAIAVARRAAAQGHAPEASWQGLSDETLRENIRAWMYWPEY